MAKETAKDQGVPDAYLGENGNFKIGMDARLKSDLVQSATGLITKEAPGNSLHVFTEKEAIALLEKRDWTSFLTRKREIIAQDEARKAETASKREEAARVRAAEKEQKDKERAEAKAAKTAEKEAAAKVAAAEASAKKADGQAAPDPKPSRSSGSKSKSAA